MQQLLHSLSGDNYLVSCEGLLCKIIKKYSNISCKIAAATEDVSENNLNTAMELNLTNVTRKDKLQYKISQPLRFSFLYKHIYKTYGKIPTERLSTEINEGSRKIWMDL